jgi:hypothetical protein
MTTLTPIRYGDETNKRIYIYIYIYIHVYTLLIYLVQRLHVSAMITANLKEVHYKRHTVGYATTNTDTTTNAE